MLSHGALWCSSFLSSLPCKHVPGLLHCTVMRMCVRCFLFPGFCRYYRSVVCALALAATASLRAQSARSVQPAAMLHLQAAKVSCSQRQGCTTNSHTWVPSSYIVLRILPGIVPCMLTSVERPSWQVACPADTPPQANLRGALESSVVFRALLPACQVVSAHAASIGDTLLGVPLNCSAGLNADAVQLLQVRLGGRSGCVCF